MNSTNKNNTSSTAAKEKQSFFRSNPVINRLNKVEERAGYGLLPSRHRRRNDGVPGYERDYLRKPAAGTGIQLQGL